eukprot:scaffold34_cov260-Pinguiococcus_pyrenoidosus.AAC.9
MAGDHEPKLAVAELFEAAEEVVRRHMARHPRPTQLEADGAGDDWDAHEFKSTGEQMESLVVPEKVHQALLRTVDTLSS